MIQNTCKLRTNNFSCDCCDEDKCQRYIAYQQGIQDTVNKIIKLIDGRYEANDMCRKTALSKHFHDDARYFQQLMTEDETIKDYVLQVKEGIE